jgi:hypothetical protein
MKKLIILMIMTGLVGITACASNEATIETAENDAEMAKDKTDAAMDDAKASAEEAEAEASDAAAEAKADAEKAEESVMASDEAADDSAGGSDNKVSVCKNGEHVRTITLVYNDESSENICQVDYEKSSGVQTLWTAITDKDYCLEQAEAFVQKQEGWGWTCSALQ